MKRINFSRFTGGGDEIEPGHWNFRPLPPREPESDPNPPFRIALPERQKTIGQIIAECIDGGMPISEVIGLFPAYFEEALGAQGAQEQWDAWVKAERQKHRAIEKSVEAKVSRDR